MELLQRFLDHDRRALARAITWVENGAPEAGELLRATYPLTGNAHVIGITGPPGAGKSTLVDKLAARFRKTGQSVAIIAVDPTSPFSGGAILGDRIRMQRTLTDSGIFMRSLAARGHLGGLTRATSQVVSLLDAFGFDIILVETVGTGQSEVEIMELAHTTCVVSIPGMGDDIQAIKAGILEIGDVFIVNKADRDGAQRTAIEIEMMLDLGHMGEPGINRWPEETAKGNRAAGSPDASKLDPTGHHSAAQMAGMAAIRPVAVRGGERHGTANPGDISWRPPIVKTIAKDNQGVDEATARMQEHLQFLRETGRWEALKRHGAKAELKDLLTLRVTEALLDWANRSGALTKLTESVATRQVDPYSATDEILKEYPGFSQVKTEE